MYELRSNSSLYSYQKAGFILARKVELQLSADRRRQALNAAGTTAANGDGDHNLQVRNNPRLLVSTDYDLGRARYLHNYTGYSRHCSSRAACTNASDIGGDSRRLYPTGRTRTGQSSSGPCAGREWLRAVSRQVPRLHAHGESFEKL